MFYQIIGVNDVLTLTSLNKTQVYSK